MYAKIHMDDNIAEIYLLTTGYKNVKMVNTLSAKS